MKKVRLGWFVFWTWFWFFAIATLSIVLGAFGLTFGGILAFFWLAARDRRYRQLQAEAGIGDAAREKELVDELVNLQRNALVQAMADSYSPSTVVCKTCRAPNPKGLFIETQQCCGLQEIFPHKVLDEPPDNNPYKDWWCQLHGYEPSPEDFPIGKLFLHPYVGDPNFVELAQERGKQYWLTHANYAWDNGFAEPPDWYVSARIERSAIA